MVSATSNRVLMPHEERKIRPLDLPVNNRPTWY